MQWRNSPGGYLREILNAKVYDVAVRVLAVIGQHSGYVAIIHLRNFI